MYKKLGFSLIVNAFFKALSLLIAVYQLRWINTNISKTDLANYNVSESYTGIISLFAGFGMAIIIQKVFTQTEDKQTRGDTWTTINVFRIFALAVGALLASFFSFIRPELHLGLMLALFLSSFIITMDYSYGALYNVRGKSHYFAMTDFIGKVFLFLALFTDGTLWHHNPQNPVFSFLTVLILSSLITFFLDAIINKKYIPKGRFDAQILKANFKPMLFLAFSSALLGLVQYFQTPIAKFFNVSESDINGFSNAFKLTNQAVFAIGTILPQFSSSLKRVISADNLTLEDRNGKIKKAMMVVVVALVFVYGILAILSPLYLNFVDPAGKYPRAQELFYILGLFVISSSVSTVVSMLNIFFDDEKFHFLGIVFQVVLTLLLSVILVPIFGIKGSAFVIVIVSFVDAFVLRMPRLFILMKTKFKPDENKNLMLE